MQDFLSEHFTNIIRLVGLGVLSVGSIWLRRIIKTNKRLIMELLGREAGADLASTEVGASKSLRALVEAQNANVEECLNAVKDYGAIVKTNSESLEAHREETRAAHASMHNNFLQLDAKIQSLDNRVQLMETTVLRGHEHRITSLESDRYRAPRRKKPNAGN